MQKIKDFIYYNRKEIITVLLCFIIFGSILFFKDDNNYNIQEYVDSSLVKDSKDGDKEVIIDKIVIDIKGEINSPGTYEFDNGGRINDAIIKAGGLTNKADTSYINLSEKLTDEMLIIIPSVEETIDLESNKEKINNTIVKDNKETIKEATIKDNKISINTASLSELMNIKGIGEIKAKSIIEYREKNGLFKSIEDITKVKGIGSSTFEKIKDYIKV